MIDPEDLQLLLVTDDSQAVVDTVAAAHDRQEQSGLVDGSADTALKGARGLG